MRLLTARLSARRRSRFAGPVVLMFALLLTGGLYTALSPASADDATSSDTDTVAKGRELFLVGCSTCHGKNGEGVDSTTGWYGPPLVGVGAASVDFQVGTGRMPLAAPGPQGADRRHVYTDEEVEALAAFVASLGPGPVVPSEEEYSPDAIPEDEREEAIVRGGEFFRTNCTACHNFAASGGALPGGKYAPTLQGVEPKHVYEAMITGPQQMPVFSDEVLTPEDKEAVIAYIKAIQSEPTGGYGGGGIGPVAEGITTWVVGLGVLIVACVWIGAHGVRVKEQPATTAASGEAAEAK